MILVASIWKTRRRSIRRKNLKSHTENIHGSEIKPTECRVSGQTLITSSFAQQASHKRVEEEEETEVPEKRAKHDEDISEDQTGVTDNVTEEQNEMHTVNHFGYIYAKTHPTKHTHIFMHIFQ